MRNIIFGIVLLSFGCKNSNTTLETDLKKEIIPETLNTNTKAEIESSFLTDIYGSNKLTLTGRFNECGEWGGHRENIIIYRVNDSLYVDFLKDSVDCTEKPFDKKTKLITNKTFGFNKKNEKNVSNYIHKLLEKKLQAQELGHAYCRYTASLNDSTLVLDYLSPGKWNEFEKLKTELIK